MVQLEPERSNPTDMDDSSLIIKMDCSLRTTGIIGYTPSLIVLIGARTQQRNRIGEEWKEQINHQWISGSLKGYDVELDAKREKT